MRKSAFFSIVLISLVFSSCASNKAMQRAEEYVDEYYTNFSERNSRRCYYQMNKNSAETIEELYGLGFEDFTSSRRRILGSVKEYEILEKKYYKTGTDRFVDFEVLVHYQNIDIKEKLQIIIKKDGQTSINYSEFEQDDLMCSRTNKFKTSLIMNETEKILQMLSPFCYGEKQIDDLLNTLEQANQKGGKLWGCEVLKSNYLYQEDEDKCFVYKDQIKMKYENTNMICNLLYCYKDGNLGIGRISIEELSDG